MVTIHIQLTVSIVLWIIITITLLPILFKMSCVIIYRHNQLKSLSWIDFSSVLNVGLRSLIHNASAIFHFRLLLWKLLSVILKSIVLTYLCDFSMLWSILAMCGLNHYDLLFSLLFNEHFLPHNRQCKLVQDISHDKLNHGYVQSQFCLWHWNNCSV